MGFAEVFLAGVQAFSSSITARGAQQAAIFKEDLKTLHCRILQNIFVATRSVC